MQHLRIGHDAAKSPVTFREMRNRLKIRNLRRGKRTEPPRGKAFGDIRNGQISLPHADIRYIACISLATGQGRALRLAHQQGLGNRQCTDFMQHRVGR